MAPKPFGKTGRKHWSLPLLAKASIGVALASPVLWMLFYLPSRRYPVLDDTPVFLVTLGFLSVLFTVAAVRALRSRPVPRPPNAGTFSRWAGPLFLGLALGLPPALGVAFMLQPVEYVINGALGRDSGRRTWAMVELRDHKLALVSPYWRDDLAIETAHLTADRPQAGDTATLDLGDGFLGMTWVRSVTIEELR